MSNEQVPSSEIAYFIMHGYQEDLKDAYVKGMLISISKDAALELAKSKAKSTGHYVFVFEVRAVGSAVPSPALFEAYDWLPKFIPGTKL